MDDLTPRKIQGFGWKRDLPDIRDKVYRASTITLPPATDLRGDPNMPDIWDQGPLGACTAFGSGAALEFERRKQGLADFSPSRLYIYYNARVIGHSTREDSGAQIRDVIKGIAKVGAPPEELWPYDTDKFARRPPRKAYTEGRKHLALQYQSVPQNEQAMKAALAARSLLVIGFTCYESLESAETARTGDVPMPSTTENVIGGHCVALTGYNDSWGKYLFRQSWGTGWGNEGYGTLPYDYLHNPSLAGDFWVIQLSE